MKIKILTTTLVLVISCAVAFAQSKTTSNEKLFSSIKTEITKDSFYYTCPMHHDVKMDKPGKCPKCGMTLVEETDIKKGGMNKIHDKKNMHNMKNMNDTTMMKHDSTKMKKCCMMDDKMDMKTLKNK